MGLTNSPLCRRCGAEDETSDHIPCECEALVSLRHAYFGSLFLDPEVVKSLSVGEISNFSKRTGLFWLDIILCGTKGPSKGLGASNRKGPSPNTNIISYHITYYMGCPNKSARFKVWGIVVLLGWRHWKFNMSFVIVVISSHGTLQ